MAQKVNKTKIEIDESRSKLAALRAARESKRMPRALYNNASSLLCQMPLQHMPFYFYFIEYPTIIIATRTNPYGVLACILTYSSIVRV